MTYLHAGRKKPKGWLRREAAQFLDIELVHRNRKEKKQLLPEVIWLLFHVKEEVDLVLQ